MKGRSVWTLASLFAVNLLLTLGWLVVYPLLPLYFKELGASVFETAVLISISGLSSLALMSPMGLLGDRYGKRKLIALGVILGIASLILFSTVEKWFQLIPYLVVYGASFASIMPSRLSIVADFTSPEDRGRIYGLMNVCWPIGGVIGPPLGGFIVEQVGWRAAFILSSLLLALCLIPLKFLSESSQPSQTCGGVEFKGLYEVLLPFFALNILISTGIGSVDPLIPLYLNKVLRVGVQEVGLFISIANLVALVSQFLSGYLTDKLGRKRTLVYSLTLVSPLFAACSFMRDYASLILIYMIAYGLWSATWTPNMTILMDLTPIHRRGLAMGLRLTCVRVGFTIGPMISGFLWEELNPVSMFYASSLFFALSLITALKLKLKW